VAIYHLSAQIIKRSEGRSAIAAAAYRAGERLVDRQSNVAFDYRNKGGIVHNEIRKPDGAPDWMGNREELWNVLEIKNRRKDAQLAREMNIALPREMTLEQQTAVLRRFVDERFVALGMVADMAIHHDEENNNPHAHVMLSFYAANENGFRRTRTREWNSKDFLTDTREAWSLYANRALEALGHEERIDHRTLEAQGIDRMPTIHEGPQGRSARARGVETTSNVIDIRTYAGKHRALDYRDIDVGRSRAAQNQRIHAFNARQMTKKLVAAMDAMDGWLQHRFMESSVKRAGLRLRDARRARRTADGAIRFWARVVKQRQNRAMVERVFRNQPKHLARTVRLITVAQSKVKQAKRRYAVARQQELTAERDYRRGKQALGRDRQERKARKQRSMSRWTTALGRVAPESITLDRLPADRRDGRWGRIASWMANAAQAQRRHGEKVSSSHGVPSAALTPQPAPRSPADAASRTGPPIAGDAPPATPEVAQPALPHAPAKAETDATIAPPFPVDIALQARAALSAQDNRIENLSRLNTRIIRLERQVRRGEASPAELEQARTERAATYATSGGDDTWKRQMDLRAAYNQAVDALSPEEIQAADIDDAQRESLDRTKAQREKQRQEHSLSHSRGIRHKIHSEPPQ